MDTIEPDESHSMKPGELTGRLEQLEALARETHEAVIRLEMKVNGGPGLSYPCQQHAKRVGDIDDRLIRVEQRAWYMVGAVAVVVFFFGLFGPSLRAILKIP